MRTEMIGSSVLTSVGEAPLSVSTEINQEEWDRYVLASEEASSYHAWRWRSIFEEAFGHETRYLAARREGDVVGILPLVLFRSPLFGRFMVSLPFVNYGGVVANDEAAAHSLLE